MGGVLAFSLFISCEKQTAIESHALQQKQITSEQIMNRIAKFSAANNSAPLRLIPIDYKIARDDIEMGLNYHMTESNPISFTRSDTFSIASNIVVQGSDTVIYVDYLVDLYSNIYDQIVYQTREMDLPDSTGEKFIMVVDLRYSQDFQHFIVDFQVGVEANPNTSPRYCAPQWVVRPTFNQGGCGPDLNTAPSNTDGSDEMNIRLNDPLCNPYVSINNGTTLNTSVETLSFSSLSHDFWRGSAHDCFTKGDQSYYKAQASTVARANRPSYNLGGLSGKKSILAYEFWDEFSLCNTCDHSHELKVRYGIAIPIDDDISNIPKNLPTL